MTRFTLHIPLVLNDGTPTPEWALEHAERELLRVADGFTATDGIGGWKHDGKVYREPVRLYAADVEAVEYALPLMLQVADELAIALEQEAVYLTRAEIQAQLVTPVRTTA